MGTSTSNGTGAHLDALDGLRAVAIGAVFLLHIDRAHFPGGALGVDVFFVLSSYLISTILLEETARRGTIGYRNFYWRRFFRLAPALVLWLALIAAPTAIIAHQVGTIPWSTAGALFYFNDFLQAFTNHVGTAYDQSWSLAVEEQFYLVWPLLLAFIATRLAPPTQRRFVVALLALSVPVWFLFGNYFLPTGHLVALALGFWVAFWLFHGGGQTRLAAAVRDVRVPVASIAVLAVGLVYAPGGNTGKALALAVDLAATALMVHCILNARSMVSSLLSSSVFRWVGVRSYGIYLYGLTLLVLIPLVTHLKLHEAAPIDVAVTAVIVAISYRYVEAPVRARGRAWLARPAEASPVAPPLADPAPTGEAG